MESNQLQGAFERDGHVALRGAFDVAAAARMSEAIWQYIEHHTDVREHDRTTWPPEWFPISFKRLKRNPAFTAALDNPTTRTTLDQIFGASGWHASKSGAQILVTFPNATKESWRVPSDLELPHGTTHNQRSPRRDSRAVRRCGRYAPHPHQPVPLGLRQRERPPAHRCHAPDKSRSRVTFSGSVAATGMAK